MQLAFPPGPPSLVPHPHPPPQQLHVTSFKISPIFSETRFRNLQSKRKKKRTKLLRAFKDRAVCSHSNRPFSVARHQPCTSLHKLSLAIQAAAFRLPFSSPPRQQAVQCHFQFSVIYSEGNCRTFQTSISNYT